MVLYNPKVTQQTDFGRTIRVIKESPLATVISSTTTYLSKEITTEISHIPFTVRSIDPETQEIVLIGHIAKDNDQYTQLKEVDQCKVVFQGKDDSYVSAAWYEQKKINHKVVSTWDYVTVHCQCEVKVVEDAEWILEMLAETTNHYEKNMRAKSDDQLIEKRWEVNEAPEKYLNGLMSRIAGLELRVKSFSSKVKMSQNKPVRDVNKVLEGYRREIGGEKAEYLTSLVKEHHPNGDQLI